MKRTFPILTTLLLCHSSLAADWDDLAVPADPGEGNSWQLQSNLSDDFNYSAPGLGQEPGFL